MTSISETTKRLDSIGDEHESGDLDEPGGMAFLADRAGIDFDELTNVSISKGARFCGFFDWPPSDDLIAGMAAVWVHGFLSGIEHTRNRDESSD